MRKFTEADGAFLDSLHWHNINWLSREIFITGHENVEDEAEPGVELRMANQVIRNLRLLDGESGDSILVHMKTCGGDCAEGFAIFDAIKCCRSHVTILSYTHARSMSSIILQAADHRVLMPSSYFMVHRGNYGDDDEWTRVRSALKFSERYDKMMLNAYADRMVSTPGSRFHRKAKKTAIDFIETGIEKRVDFYLSAREAVAVGLADEIFDGKWDRIR